MRPPLPGNMDALLITESGIHTLRIGARYPRELNVIACEPCFGLKSLKHGPRCRCENWRENRCSSGSLVPRGGIEPPTRGFSVPFVPSEDRPLLSADVCQAPAKARQGGYAEARSCTALRCETAQQEVAPVDRFDPSPFRNI